MKCLWFSAQELAGLGLPAIAGTERGVQLQATREGWQSRPREGRGGGREYHLTSLPEAARIELALRAITRTPPADRSSPAEGHTVSAGQPPTPAGPDALPSQGDVPHRRARATGADGRDGSRSLAPRGRASTRAAARLVIVNQLATFREEGGLSAVCARSAFSGLFNAGAIPIEGWVKAEVGKLSVTSLARWQAQLAREGAARLAGKYGTRKGKGQIEGDVQLRDFCIAMMAMRPHLNAGQLVQSIGARFGRAIPKRTVQRFMATARETYAEAFLMARNPDAWKNKHLVAFGSLSEALSAPNEVWELDASPADIMCLDPEAEKGKRRYHLIAALDVWPRRAKVLVSEVPKSTATLALCRRSILDWGVPRKIKTDNGKDFISAHVGYALGSLMIEHKPCAPFTPEGKPHVERFFHTLQHDFISLLPGFVGHNVADRKGIEARRAFSDRLGESDNIIAVELTAADLQAKIDEWIEHVYHRRPHSELKTSPMLKAASWSGEVARIEDERALDVLLAEAPDADGGRTVGKKGIRAENTIFIAPELGAHVGARVIVRLDPTDMGRIIVYDLDNNFICVAEAPERTGISREEVARAAKLVQREDRKATRAYLKDLEREHKPHRIADEIVAAARADKVVMLPHRGTTYTTPALDAAGDAARALDNPMPHMPARAGGAEPGAETHEALVLRMPEREAHAARLSDDWLWFQWARENFNELNDIQRENYHALENDEVIQIRLQAERNATA
ncbi:MAG: Mu transposase C-terminal domain-containing protein [Parvibaculum sp.]|uniref:Mu transposase C-terminal domain-containing protein n=1 Tax=Parvibaculum sp. TaxID=2024848 RepID=UPI00272367DD|nr:Mu transposase C-terminal domain-containing protein [Parvibaculum sp.]MDO8837980.1 Mu transposase C-terminal domain-containing protein [Parvibaculum sp.]